MPGVLPRPQGAPQDVPGLEYAGEVDALGPDAVGPLAVGDRVFGLVPGGGQAEFVVTPERMAVPIPGNLDFIQAAAVPEVFMTAHDALEARAGLRPGETVLVHAVGSGVGTAAAQLARAMGCTVFGTSRTPEKLKRAGEMGLDLGIDSRTEDFAEVIHRHTGGRGVDAIIDLVGAPVMEGNLKALATGGRLVLVGMLGGGTGTVDFSMILRKRLRVIGTTMRARPPEEKIAVARAFADRVIPWLARGLVRPVVDRVFAFDEVRSASSDWKPTSASARSSCGCDWLASLALSRPSRISRTRSSGVMNRRSCVTTTRVVLRRSWRPRKIR